MSSFLKSFLILCRKGPDFAGKFLLQHLLQNTAVAYSGRLLQMICRWRYGIWPALGVVTSLKYLHCRPLLVLISYHLWKLWSWYLKKSTVNQPSLSSYFHLNAYWKSWLCMFSIKTLSFIPQVVLFLDYFAEGVYLLWSLQSRLRIMPISWAFSSYFTVNINNNECILNFPSVL